jgi:hypothetical protein
LFRLSGLFGFEAPDKPHEPEKPDEPDKRDKPGLVMIEIDGSQYSGSGTIVRQAVMRESGKSHGNGRHQAAT